MTEGAITRETCSFCPDTDFESSFELSGEAFGLELFKFSETSSLFEALCFKLDASTDSFADVTVCDFSWSEEFWDTDLAGSCTTCFSVLFSASALDGGLESDTCLSFGPGFAVSFGVVRFSVSFGVARFSVSFSTIAEPLVDFDGFSGATDPLCSLEIEGVTFCFLEGVVSSSVALLGIADTLAEDGNELATATLTAGLDFFFSLKLPGACNLVFSCK